MSDLANVTTKQLSLVIPVYNEEANLHALHDEIAATLSGDYEVIFVDDGSQDGSFEVLQTLAAVDPHVVVIRFRRNFGQTAAFAAGFDYADGAVVVTLDADGQNNPADIPVLLEKLDEGYDVVNGWRQNRQDNVVRRVPSRVANRLIARSTGVQLHDRGCSLRAMRSEVVKELRLYGEMHRFIPELISNAGFSMAEVPVSHRPRVAGQSKYGLSRTFRVILDLMTILFLRHYGDRPMHFFGALGIVSGGLGFFTLLYLFGVKLWAGLSGGLDGFNATTIGDRPLLLLGVLLSIIGVQFLTMGLLAELQVRTYYESQNKPVYYIRDVISAENKRTQRRKDNN
ncbi:MAG: glycosyltransferase family 2 protein [Anaerolineae bacterium]|nr:glycosyltransferase family 2 protein [Anaerolineae bacterium]